jgi:hypothetical protein
MMAMLSGVIMIAALCLVALAGLILVAALYRISGRTANGMGGVPGHADQERG